MTVEHARLQFAYRYPFSSTAKAVVAGMHLQSVDPRYLRAAEAHVQTAMAGGVEYVPTRMASAMSDYLMVYLYSRMLVSAASDRATITMYSSAEARRSAAALSAGSRQEQLEVASDLGFSFHPAATGTGAATVGIALSEYLKRAPRSEAYLLVNQRLSNGVVTLAEARVPGLLIRAMQSAISAGLPIPAKELPPEVIERSRGIRAAASAAMARARPQAKGEYGWIERLLDTPIPDVRHRTVNLILAPYLVTIKGMDVKEATSVVQEYIRRCKELEPNTNVNERYISYQCAYAKRRGLKPLSFERARDLLGDAIGGSG